MKNSNQKWSFSVDFDLLNEYILTFCTAYHAHVHREVEEVIFIDVIILVVMRTTQYIAANRTFESTGACFEYMYN